MHDDDQLMRFLRTIVSDAFPTELDEFDLAAEKQLERLRRGAPDSSRKADQFEFLDEAHTVVECLLLLKATIEAMHWANDLRKHLLDTRAVGATRSSDDLSEVWARELRHAGLSREKASDIASRFADDLKQIAGLKGQV